MGLLDENVFLYSEEPILMSKVLEYGGKVFYHPLITVRHLHQTNKTNVAQYKHFIKSRLYFLSKYKKYSFAKIFLLNLTYNVVLVSKLLRSTKKK